MLQYGNLVPTEFLVWVGTCPRFLLFFPLRPNFQNLFQAKATKIPFLHALQAKTTIHVVYNFMGTHPFHSF